jgi:hypothetical protein
MSRERTDHDQVFKKLFTEFFFEFIDLFLPEVASYIRRDPPQFLDKELFADAEGRKRKEVDLVAKLKFLDSDAFLLIHIENQDEARRGFVRRVFHYVAHHLNISTNFSLQFWTSNHSRKSTHGWQPTSPRLSDCSPPIPSPLPR